MVFIIGDSKSQHVKKYCNFLQCHNTPYVLFSFSERINNPLIVAYDIIRIIVKIYFHSSNSKIVHIHYIGKYAILGFFLSFFGYRVIYTAWGSDILLEQTKFKVWVIRLCLLKSFAVLGDSERIKSRLKSIYKNINYIHYDFGVDPIFLETNFVANYNLPKILMDKITEDVNLFISVRRLENIYNIKLILDSFIALLKSAPNSLLIVMGDGSLFEELTMYSKDYRNNIIFIGAFDEIALVSFLKLSPIVISASASDAGLSTTIAECMAFGSICILSDVADNSLWIEKKYKNLLFSLTKESLLSSMLFALSLEDQEKEEIAISQRYKIINNNDGLASTKNVIKLCYNVEK
jgi:glycosyltransferase involved in cell wall biosynthesis